MALSESSLMFVGLVLDHSKTLPKVAQNPLLDREVPSMIAVVGEFHHPAQSPRQQ